MNTLVCSQIWNRFCYAAFIYGYTQIGRPFVETKRIEMEMDGDGFFASAHGLKFTFFLGFLVGN